MSFKDYALELVGLGVGSAISLSIYSILKNGKKIISSLEKVPEFEITSSLSAKVANSSVGIPACIWGTVKAIEKPIQSITHPEKTGVIWKHTIREHLLTQVMGVWVTGERTIESTRRTTPFMLMDNGIPFHINSLSKLEDVDMTVINDKFETASTSLIDHLWGFMKGVRSTGTQQTEEMLLEGTRAMGIGRLIMENGILHLKPEESLPFVITAKNKEDLIDELKSEFPKIRFLGFVATCGTAYILFRILRRLYTKWGEYAQQKHESALLEAARQRRVGGEADLPENLMCVICCGLRDVVLIPCQHVCICGECALRLEPRHCPVCRSQVDVVQAVYYS